MTRAFAPAILHKVRRFLKGPQLFHHACDKSWEIYPSTTRQSPPAIFEETDLGKVTACQEHTSRTFEWGRIRGGLAEHRATTAFRVRDVVLHRGYAYARGVKLPLESHREAFDLVIRGPRLAEAALACSLFGNRFFGHFLTDDLPMSLVAATIAEPVRTSQVDTQHQAQYRVLGGVTTTPIESAAFDSLVVVDDVGQNEGKRQRYEQLRTRLRGGVEARSSPGAYLVRGATGVARRLVNEEALQASLSKRGFAIVRPEDLSVAEIISALSGASVVVAVEGSQLSHAIMAIPNRAAVVALQPPYRFNNVYKDYADCLGMRYGFVVGDEVADGFSVELDALNRLLDRLMAH